MAAVAGFLVGGDGADDGGATRTIVAGEPPGVTAKMLSSGGEGTLRLANVHDLPPGRVLEAWVQRGGAVEPVRGLFVPDHAGRAATTIPDMEGVEAVMVTAEPRGGSERPTSDPLVTIAVPG